MTSPRARLTQYLRSRWHECCQQLLAWSSLLLRGERALRWGLEVEACLWLVGTWWYARETGHGVLEHGRWRASWQQQRGQTTGLRTAHVTECSARMGVLLAACQGRMHERGVGCQLSLTLALAQALPLVTEARARWLAKEETVTLWLSPRSHLIGALVEQACSMKEVTSQRACLRNPRKLDAGCAVRHLQLAGCVRHKGKPRGTYSGKAVGAGAGILEAQCAPGCLDCGGAFAASSVGGPAAPSPGRLDQPPCAVG